MALLDQWAAAQDEMFQRKVYVAILKTAKIVQAEDETSLSLPAGIVLNNQQLHDKRSELAYAVLRSPAAFVQLFAAAAAANAAITNASTDAAIETEVAACWNHLSLNGAD